MRFPWMILLALVAACGDPHAAARDKAVADARAALASDPSEALHLAHAASAEHGPDPRLALVSGLACMKLNRRDDAIAEAEAGLASESLPADVRAELEWVRGAGLLGRYLDLNVPADAAAANIALERATEAGLYRVQAAAALVGLQDRSPAGSPERLLRFARLVLELQPEGEAATQVKALLEKRGLKP